MESPQSKRVDAKQAATILGVSSHLISRLDSAGKWIKRFKLTRKTHVYDVDSLYRYLESCQSKPLQSPVVGVIAGRSAALSKVAVGFGKQKCSLSELLQPKRKP